MTRARVIAWALCGWLSLLLAGTPAGAQAPVDATAVATARSPDGNLQVSVRVDADGRPEYAIHRGARALLDWSRLGFILADAPKLERNFEIAGQEQSDFDDTWEQPWGERRFVRNHGTQLRVMLRERTGARRNLGVVFQIGRAHV